MMASLDLHIGSKTPDGLCSSIRIQEEYFGGEIAIGVIGEPGPTDTSWVVLALSSGRCVGWRIAVLDRDALADELLEVSVAVAAEAAVWDKISAGGWDAFLEAVSRLRLSVTGNTPFFIRYLVSVVDVLSAVWSDAGSSPPQPASAEIISEAPEPTPEVEEDGSAPLIP